MKIIMTLLVRDEEDIIRQNIDFHLSQGVDFIIATDNLSEDSTPDILKEYEKRGKLRYIFEERDNYNQHEWVTRMARMATLDYGADWVINNDADEFWWPLKGSIREAISSLPHSKNIIQAQRRNFVYLGMIKEDRPFYERMLYKEICSKNVLGKPLPPVVAHRGNEDVVVAQGNESVRGIGNQNIVEDLIEVFHFPIRTKTQFINKIKKGGSAYKNNTELPKETGITWKKLYEIYFEDGHLDEYLRTKAYDKLRLNKDLLSGMLIRDDRLKKFLCNLYTS